MTFITNYKKKKIIRDSDTVRMLYTDDISMSAGDDGVTLNIVQRVGERSNAFVISKVGMTKSRAKKFIKKFKKLVLVTKPLPKTKKITN